MGVQIEPYKVAQREAVVELSLRAWAPVFPHIEASLEPAVFAAFYPAGWRVSQKEAVEGVLDAEDTHVWVAISDDSVSGFVAVKRHDDTMGEIYMVAVDPETQKRGIGVALTDFAVDWMRKSGLSVAMVETGSDPGHGPARRTYVKAGFTLFPVSRYFMKL
jgi:ribosomal protein S18 acetylase RimI-like enzyme